MTGYSNNFKKIKNKKLVALFGGICLVIVLAVLPFLAACAAPTPTPTPALTPTPTPAPEPITLKVVSSFFPDDPSTLPLFPFIDKVNERADGELVIEYLGGPEVMSEFEMYEAVAQGRMDMAHGVASFSPGVIKAATAQIVWTVGAEEYRASGTHDYWNEVIHHPANIEILGWSSPGPGGSFLTFLKQDVETSLDLAGLKLGDGAIMPSGISSLGGIPTTIAYVEMYTSVERGVIDGLLYPPAIVILLKIHEVIDYVIGNPIGSGDINIIMNLDKFNSLPEHLQALLKEVGEGEETLAEAYFIDVYLEAKEYLEDYGIEFIYFTREDEETYLEHMYEGQWAFELETDPDVAPQLMELSYKRGDWPGPKMGLD